MKAFAAVKELFTNNLRNLLVEISSWLRCRQSPLTASALSSALQDKIYSAHLS